MMNRHVALWDGAALLQRSVLLLVLVVLQPPLTGGLDSDRRDGIPVFDPEKEHSLVLLQMLFRHGDRSPTHVFPWDEHEHAWPQGTGQLTTLGMKQAYNFGTELRNRYDYFLPQEYDQFAVEARSTDYDRTLMTVQCLLTGLFPANITDWPLDHWQPIPIHTQPNDIDQLFSHAPCPKWGQLEEQYMGSSPVQQFQAKYQPLFDQLSEHTGMNVTDVEAHQITDMFFCEAQHNMSRPVWMTDDIFNAMMDFRNESRSENLVAPGLVRLGGGPLLAEMTRNMQKRANDSFSREKLFLFSAHDTTVMRLGLAMGIFNELQPPYLTTIIIELHQQDDNFFVKTLFDNHTSDSPYLKTIEGCAEMCPLDQFQSLLKDNMLLSTEREVACVLEAAAWSFWKQNGVSILTGVIIVLAAAVAALAYKLKRAKHQPRDVLSSVRYRQLLQDNADDEEEDDKPDEL